MKVTPECFPCFYFQAVRTCRFLGLKDDQIWDILKSVHHRLLGFNREATPARIGKDVYCLISEKTGIPDPYEDVKKSCTQKALALYPDLKKRIRASSDSFRLAVRAAIAGNVIDFGTERDLDLKNDIEANLQLELTVDLTDELRSMVEKAHKILYIGDNAGETVFDLLLIEELKKPVIYAVRSAPIINDAVEKDARLAGLQKVARILPSGSTLPGTELKDCTPEFLEIFRSADVIISKGQGNYECLSEEKGPLFFLLKAKCAAVARDIGVRQGSLVLLRSRLFDSALSL
ncbi:MAG: ARMT1-like domain-containing protein [Candidatus Aminicenantes bacterium]|nr:ARMT1-like domain-containing protein [Candidatus Aminicenantes bacterium]